MRIPRQHLWLVAILLVAALLRLWGLERGDPMSDEVTYAFRAIGLVDSFNDPGIQTTTWEWLDSNIPWWAHLSFHDHPPLVFWIQYLAMRLFGEALWPARLAAALFGIGSVWLLFLISRRLYSPRVALLAAALFGLTVNHVYISRTAQQESFLIFFLLLALYFFLRSLENPRFLILTGAAAGLAMLAKYTAVIIAPVVLTYLLLFRREYLQRKHLWLGIVAAIVVLTPVIIYNIALYQSRGHFDLQLSHLLGVEPEAWQKTPGKDIGSLGVRLKLFLPRLVHSQSWLLIALAAAAILGFLKQLPAHPASTWQRHGFLAIITAYLILLILSAGPAIRFLTVLTPFLAIAAAGIFVALADRLRQMRTASIAVAAVLAFEIFYTVNNQISASSYGPRPWLASPLRYETYPWGYRELEAWLEAEFAGRYPAFTFETTYGFITSLQEKRLTSARKRGDTPYPALVLYHGGFDPQPELWSFSRRLLYDGWPIMTLDDYRKILSSGNDPFAEAGIRSRYLILRATSAPTPAITDLVGGGEPISIRNSRGEAAFRIYQF